MGLFRKQDTSYCNQFFCSCQENTAHYLLCPEYTVLDCLQGGGEMCQNGEAGMDLDDLIFDENDGGPSER